MQRDCGVLGKGHASAAVWVMVGIGCERVDARWRSSQIKRSVNGDVRIGWTPRNERGRYEDNRERVQRHDPIANPRTAGSVKGAATCDTQASYKPTKTAFGPSGISSFLRVVVHFVKPPGTAGNHGGVHFRRDGKQIKWQSQPESSTSRSACALRGPLPLLIT